MGIRVLPGKQPVAGTILAPIGSQIFKQLFGQNGVAVFFALALIDPYQHPVRITFDVMGLEAHQFTDPKTGTVGGLQQQEVFEIICCCQQSSYFLHAIDCRQFSGTGTRGYLKLGLVPLAESSVEANKAGQIGIHRAPSQFAIFQKIEKIAWIPMLVF